MVSWEDEYMRVIEDGWNTYLSKLVPKEAGIAQVVDTQRAFYGGASFLLFAMFGILRPNKAAMDVAPEKVEALYRELDAFFKSDDAFIKAYEASMRDDG